MSALNDKVNELSLMVVLSTGADPDTLRMSFELCQELLELSRADASAKKLHDATNYVIEQKSILEDSAWDELVKKFTTAAIAFVENTGNVAFPNEGKSTNATNLNPDLKSDLDPSLIAEFIESHTLLLEDFESQLTDYRLNGGDAKEFTTAIKRYLHNLKGDAGSVGVIGVEKACHAVEDILISKSASDLIPNLIQFREWAGSWLKALANNGTAESSTQFLQRFNAADVRPQAEKSTVKPATQSPGSKGKVHEAKSEYQLSGDKEILVEFAAEAEEHLLNVETVVLEAEGNFSKDSIDTIFRGVHSVKGGSAYFNLQEMTQTSHILENLLHEVRDGKRNMDQGLSDLVLSYIDLQKSLLSTARTAMTKDGNIKRCPQSIELVEALEAYESGAAVPEVLAADSGKNKTTTAESAEAEGVKDNKLNVKNFVKIDTGRLDHLIDSIGEMVIYSSMLIRLCREHLLENEEVLNVSHRVEKFSRDLQDIGMSMRLVPIKGLFQKMSRLVWDTSKKIGKDVAFEMSGEDTELDRNLIDKLADPLMHMVRNSLDHGIEPPEERVKLGKPRTGKVKLSAAHSGGTILIKIEDDGRGINPEKIVAKAIEKGIINEATKLTEQEIFQLIFAAGFSTAAVVTDISGRGVGMDVVRRNVESLRGNIHIESKVGAGSVFTIELPLTLAIIDGIQIRVGSDFFIVPSLSIIEFIRPKPEMINYTLDQGATFHFRGKYLPIFSLAEIYGINTDSKRPLDATFLIVQSNQDLIAFMVDEILGEYSTVIKSLGPAFEGNRGVSGCAIMPDGDVALILDIRSLTQLARTHPNAKLVLEPGNEAVALLQ